MDSSTRFSPARLKAIKGEPTILGGIHPKEIATLLFEESVDLQTRNFLRAFVEGPETGVPIDRGRRTIPFSDLKLPEGMVVTAVYSGWIGQERAETNYPPEFTDPASTWGVLALACDTENKPHWLWLTIWTGWFKHEPTCEELTVDSMTERFSGVYDRGLWPVPCDEVYMSFVHVVSRRAETAKEFMLLLQRSGERYERILKIMRRRKV
jgi:hypothetical protein